MSHSKTPYLIPIKQATHQILLCPAAPTLSPPYTQSLEILAKLQIDSLDPYFADSVVYQDATGMNFHGPKQKLFEFAKKDVESLDSLRFDINAWQSIHVNDKNDDWVDIWAVERVYQEKKEKQIHPGYRKIGKLKMGRLFISTSSRQDQPAN